MPPMDRRPPLPVSPRRLRPRRNLRPVPSDQTPPASKITQLPNRSPVSGNPLHRPEYQLISSELMNLAKRVKEDFGENDDLGTALNSSISYTGPFFERGRFYEVYSARRNERLKRRKGDIAEEAVAQDPGIAVELAKRRNSKKAEGLRKSVPANFSVIRGSSLRSSVRSSQEIKKASAALGSCEKSAADVRKRIGTRSVRKL